MAIVDIRVLAGERFNILETGTPRIATATADPLFPMSNLYDGRPSRPFRTAAITACQVIVDGNSLVNGGLEAWAAGLPTGWTAAGGVTQTVVAGEFVVGSAVKFTGGGWITQDFTVRAGEARCLDFWIKGSGGANVCQVTLQNLQTGHWLQANGTWAALAATVGTNTNSVYTHFAVTYRVEAFSVTQTSLCTLRVKVETGGSAFTDEVYDYPAADFVSVHGHTLDTGMVVTFRSSTDDFIGVNTVESTLAVLQPAFYSLLPAPVYRRYFLLEILGSVMLGSVPVAIIELGEVVIGQTYSLIQGPTYGAELGLIRDDVSTETGLGEQHVYARTNHARRTLGLKFRFDSETKYRAARDEVFRRSAGRTNPIVVIPDTTLPDVIFGRIDRGWKVTRTLVAYYDSNDLTVLEAAFPIATN